MNPRTKVMELLYEATKLPDEHLRVLIASLNRLRAMSPGQRRRAEQAFGEALVALLLKDSQR